MEAWWFAYCHLQLFSLSLRSRLWPGCGNQSWASREWPAVPAGANTKGEGAHQLGEQSLPPSFCAKMLVVKNTVDLDKHHFVIRSSRKKETWRCIFQMRNP